MAVLDQGTVKALTILVHSPYYHVSTGSGHSYNHEKHSTQPILSCMYWIRTQLQHRKSSYISHIIITAVPIVINTEFILPCQYLIRTQLQALTAVTILVHSHYVHVSTESRHCLSSDRVHTTMSVMDQDTVTAFTSVVHSSYYHVSNGLGHSCSSDNSSTQPILLCQYWIQTQLQHATTGSGHCYSMSLLDQDKVTAMSFILHSPYYHVSTDQDTV